MASIEKRGENSYRLTVSCGYDSRGRKVFKRKTINLADIKPNKQMAEAEKQFILFQEEVKRGLFLDGGKITFENFIVKWLDDYASPNLAPKTLFSYKDMLTKRIIPALGHIKLNKLQPTHLLEFYNNLREDGMRLDKQYRAKSTFFDILSEHNITLEEFVRQSLISKRTIGQLKKGSNISAQVVNNICSLIGLPSTLLFDAVGHTSGLSDRSILYHHRIISSILTSAVQWQYIVTNPASRVKPPKVEKKEASHFDFEQTEYIFRLIDNEPLKYKAMLYLCIFGGLRTGELNALEWSDISWDNSSISINKASQYLPGQGTFTKAAKNDSSERVISLPDLTMDILREYQEWQNDVKSQLGDLWIDTDRIFTKLNGEAIFPQTVGKWFSNFILRHNNSVMNDATIPPERKADYLLDKVNFHGLRHTNASLLISQNIDIATVSKRLGHASISTTLNIYAHALKKLDRTASDSLGTLFSNNNQSTKKNDA